MAFPRSIRRRSIDIQNRRVIDKAVGTGTPRYKRVVAPKVDPLGCAEMRRNTPITKVVGLSLRSPIAKKFKTDLHLFLRPKSTFHFARRAAA